MTLGSHQQCVGKSQAHITPKWILDAIGPFDLDPAAADPRPWNCAAINWTTRGLDREWSGFVYLNPPFDRYEVGTWIARLARHGNGICLLHSRTEAAWFEPVWQHAAAVLFLADRIKFCRPDGSEQPHNSGAPPILVAFGDQALQRLQRCGIGGALLPNGAIRRGDNEKHVPPDRRLRAGIRCASPKNETRYGVLGRWRALRGDLWGL